MPTVTSKDGTKIGYDVKGKGPAIIVVTGATQYRAVDQWTPQIAEMLGGQFRVISYDRRGRGESGATQPYAPAREVEDIAALIEAAGGHAHLLGLSSGAVLAFEAAAALPGVDKVFGYEPPIDPEQSSADSWKQANEFAAMAARGEKGAMMERFLGEVGMPPEDIQGFKHSPAWAAFEAVGHTLAHDFRLLAEATDGDNFPERWKKIKAPVIVANGDASHGFMGPGADAVAKAIPNAKRKVLAGQTHEVSADVLAPLLVEFFGA